MDAAVAPLLRPVRIVRRDIGDPTNTIELGVGDARVAAQTAHGGGPVPVPSELERPTRGYRSSTSSAAASGFLTKRRRPAQPTATSVITGTSVCHRLDSHRS